ncbi:MAG: hypothetical protein H0V24_12380 [Chloroflexia bacterium]|nr:hypothetical protein [Chloroflexia bacterium]
MGAQAVVWFGLAAIGGLFVIWLLFSRYVRKDQQTVRSGNGFFLYAACVLLFALGALAAGLFSTAAGR